MLRGMDVSAYQSSTYNTDGLSFVFVKATEGRSYINPKLTAQTQRARNAGCVVGFYHFLWPGNLTAQAEYFVSKAPEKLHFKRSLQHPVRRELQWTSRSGRTGGRRGPEAPEGA